MSDISIADEAKLPAVSTIPEKCKRCYTCVRECPAKAIKVEEGQAVVIEDRCIACGNCVKVCAQNAKHIKDSTGHVHRLFAWHDCVYACLAPSFPAAFEGVTPGQVVAAVRQLGFDTVWEVAFGAELISGEYAKLFERARRTGASIIATPCPAIVAYIEKYMPALQGALAPIVSPMIATARAIRCKKGNVPIVFIGPCIAKKNEIHDPNLAGCVDAVLTFKELKQMFRDAGIEPSALKESSFDSPRCYLGRTFPISGGLLKTSGLGTDILESEIIITEGKERVLDVLRELAEGKSKARFFDVLFCEGCINGPMMSNDLSMFARKDMVVDYVADQSKYTTQRDLVEGRAEFEDVDLSREFTAQNIALPTPSEEDIADALRAMKKFAPEDQLNCGACGYSTCREKAIAVCQGLAESEMCLPYLIDELQQTCVSLQESHEELAATHHRLVQTERLASMGQLSAGVAHELNNPLGTVLLFSHMLLKNAKEGGAQREDLQMIANEATRCKKIVRGLLDFARQSRISKTPTDLVTIIEEVMSVMAPKAQEKAAQLTADIQDNLPTMMLDGHQVKQMLVNLIGNAIEAIGKPNGKVVVRTHLRQGDDNVEIEVRDNGAGVSRENLTKLFTPFFTTKEIGQGTGLGLAIAYGIVKMHSGDIRADSEEGKGTIFTIRLPVEAAEESADAAVQGVTVV